MSQRSKWSLIGIPDHQGVENVGGRIGAANAPAAFRREFARLKGRDPVGTLMHDGGNVAPLVSDIQKNHQAAADTIQNAHRASPLSVVVGGGHDHGYSHLLGIAQAYPRQRIGCINIDAHLDVRKPLPVITSGSPFYLAVESGILDPKLFVEFGIQSHCNGPELWDFVDHHGIRVVPFEDLRHDKAVATFRTTLKKLASRCDKVVISLDMDAAAMAFAPGVSAPQVEGFSSTDILEMVEAAGEIPKVCSLGIFELNPEHDPDHRTAKLAAVAAWHFVARALRRE